MLTFTDINSFLLPSLADSYVAYFFTVNTFIFTPISTSSI